MKKSDAKQFSESIMILASAIGCEMPLSKIEIFFKVLSDLTIDQFKQAAAKFLGSWSHPGLFPTPAQFKESVFGNAKQRAQNALEIALKSIDSYHSVRFEDPATMVAIERVFGNWPSFCDQYCHMPEDRWAWRKKEFFEAYQDAVEMNLEPKHKYFPGIIETGNEMFPNYQPQEVYLISATGLESKISRLSLIAGGIIDSPKQLLENMPAELKESLQ